MYWRRFISSHWFINTLFSSITSDRQHPPYMLFPFRKINTSESKPAHQAHPDRTFQNFKVSKSGNRKLYVVPTRRSTDFKASKLWNVRSEHRYRTIITVQNIWHQPQPLLSTAPLQYIWVAGGSTTDRSDFTPTVEVIPLSGQLQKRCPNGFDIQPLPKEAAASSVLAAKVRKQIKRVWISQAVKPFTWKQSDTRPTLSQFFVTQIPSIDRSIRHKARRSTNFEALKLREVRLGKGWLTRPCFLQ